MTRIDHPQGTDNVLHDLDFEDAEELSAKAALAFKLNELIDLCDLVQTEAAALTGMTQPKVSQVRCYKLQNISLERLMRALVSLDQHVEIVVRPARAQRQRTPPANPPGAGHRSKHPPKPYALAAGRWHALVDGMRQLKA